MDWEDLHYAVEVARGGGVTAAARALGVAPSTVYRRITSFEARVGAKLVDRRGGAYALTPAGQALLAEGVALDDRIAALERGLRTRSRTVEGEVTVACAELLAVEVPRYLAPFRAAHPRLRLRLLAGTKAVDLDRHEADIALRATAAPGDRLVGRKVADVAFAVYASAAYAASHPVSGPLAALDWVCFDEARPETPQRRWEQATVPSAQVALRTNSRAAFLEAILAGAGVGVLPCGAAAKAPALVAISPVLPALTLPLWLLTHAEIARTPRVRVVLDFLGAALGRERALLEGRDLDASARR